MITELADLLKKGEMVNAYPSHVTPRAYMMPAELVGRLFTEFTQLADEVDMLQELLSQHTITEESDHDGSTDKTTS